MRRYAAAYGLWLLGVLSAALVAYYYYRTYVLPIGEQELERQAAWQVEPEQEEA